LRQVGWEVDVYERSRVELVGRGAGITTCPELLDALEKCGAGTRDLGLRVEKQITIDRSARAIDERTWPQILSRQPDRSRTQADQAGAAIAPTRPLGKSRRLLGA
jgi:2-polyprenyl-6-methoxyphenol hydroxylase-like FAD-dependent oxidoreductase